MMRMLRQKRRWWLEFGSERCSACDQTYVYDTGYRCGVCDVALCSICIDENAAVVWCVTCKLSESGS